MPTINGTLKDNMHLIRFGTVIVLIISFFIYLRADADSLRVDSDSLKIKQEQISNDVQKVKTDVAVTKNDVEHIKTEQSEQKIMLQNILNAVTDD